MIKDLIAKNRSYRRFDENHTISRETLVELVELARESGSAANLQPLKYVLTADAATNARVFPTLAWAGYLKDWPGPAEGERPTAYITILCDTNICKSAGCDHGIAAQSILLGAVEKGLGGCMIGSIRRDELREVLRIPAHLDVLLVIALGKPAETVILEDADSSGNIRYYRDSEDNHYVPKRRLEDIILDL